MKLSSFYSKRTSNSWVYIENKVAGYLIGLPYFFLVYNPLPSFYKSLKNIRRYSKPSDGLISASVLP